MRIRCPTRCHSETSKGGTNFDGRIGTRKGLGSEPHHARFGQEGRVGSACDKILGSSTPEEMGIEGPVHTNTLKQIFLKTESFYSTNKES